MQGAAVTSTVLRVMDVRCEECGAQSGAECVKWMNGAWVPLSRCILPTGRPTTYHTARRILFQYVRALVTLGLEGSA